MNKQILIALVPSSLGVATSVAAALAQKALAGKVTMVEQFVLS